MVETGDIILRGLRCRCPRCAVGRVYSGVLKVRPACPHCGLDFQPLSADDGPAAFLIFIVLAIVVPLAGWTAVRWSPPVWLHLLLWGPLILLLTISLLRPAKALLMGLKFHKGAA